MNAQVDILEKIMGFDPAMPASPGVTPQVWGMMHRLDRLINVCLDKTIFPPDPPAMPEPSTQYDRPIDIT